MGFAESIKTCLTKYATFSGRASRSEFWWFYLAQIIIYGIASSVSEVVYAVAFLLLLLPSLAVQVRRVHDTGHCGWWILCPIYNIILYCSASDEGENEYGTLEEE